MSEKTVVQAVVRPKKVAVLVPFNISEEDFRDILEFLGWLWGGRYACIIPFDPADSENELGMIWLMRYSPDVVLWAKGSCNKEWQDRIQENIAPLCTIALRYPLSDNLHINRAHLFLLNPVMENYARRINSLPDTSTRFKFVSTEYGISNRIFYDLSFGVLNREGCEGLAKFVRAKSVHIESGSVPEFIKLHDDEKYPFSYLDVSVLELTRVNAFGGYAPTIFVLSSSVKDYAWFWNNRFSFSGGGNNCLAVPVDSLNDRETVSALSLWLIGYHSGRPNYCKIKSISVSKSELDSLARKLRPRLRKFGYEHVDVEAPTKALIPQVVFEHKRHDIDAVWIDEYSFEFSCPQASFVDETNSNTDCWMVDLRGGRNLKFHIPPEVCFKTNTRLLNAPSPSTTYYSMGIYSRRYSYGDISIEYNKKDRFKIVTLPTAEELLVPLLKDKGIEEKKDEKRVCYESVIELFGGVSQFLECCKEKRFKIISALWTDKALPCEKEGSSVSKGCSIKQSDAPIPILLNQIKQRTRMGADFDKPFQDFFHYDFIKDPLILKTAKARLANEKGFYRQNTPKSFISWMVEAAIIRQVFHYPKCFSCDNESDWGSQIDLARPLHCSRCGNTVSIQDSSLDVGYQMNPLVYKAFKEGIRPVALTLGVLKRATAGGFLYIPGFKGTYEKKDFDIDIMAVCDGDLIFCECKTMEGISAQASGGAKVLDQLEQLIEKGNLCGARSVVLASLADGYPQKIQKLAKNKSTSTMRVVLLTKADLLRGHTKSQRDNMGESPARLSEAFLPQAPSTKRKRKGERRVSFGSMEVSE